MMCVISYFNRIYSSIAQSVEHAAVNRRVVGSSPTWGATPLRLILSGFFVIIILFVGEV